MSKHSRDLLHHAEAKGDSELKRHAEKAFEISSKMAGVKDRKQYSEIRDLEHHAEDLITGLRTERKKLQGNDESDCPTCGFTPKHLNRGDDQELNSSNSGGISMKMKDSIKNSLVGGFVGKGISVATPMVVTGTTAGVANKTIANLVIGVGLEALALYKKLPAKAEYPVAIAGGNLIANEIVDLLMGYIPAPAPAAMAMVATNAGAPAAAVGVSPGIQPYATTFGAAGGSAGYSNGSLIFID